ncbi:alpha/beta hydrolase [Candidatus Pacearchaeota archaeon]|nr:alpha/beta hydrolase [Candidatus Pacearchaeota archaeon]
MENKKPMIFLLIFIGLLVIIISLFVKTGIMQTSSIDERDLSRWEYEENTINNSNKFVIQGSNETCWYLIHGYTETPDSMRELAQKINEEFNETVFATRLNGHGEVPSHILNLSLNEWYSQTSGEFDELKINCKKINVVGFSFGGTLATRLSEEKKVEHSFLLAPYLFPRFNTEILINSFSNTFVYFKKSELANLNNEESTKNYIAYWNFPLIPIQNSENFFQETIKNLKTIKNPILIQHSTGDTTSSIKSSKVIYAEISSEIKELKIYNKSNHILLLDYDKNETINSIIEFEKKLRFN